MKMIFPCFREKGIGEKRRVGYSRGGLLQVGQADREKALQILQGANPAEIPIDVQSDFSITVNLKAAKEMNVTVPQSVLDRASELIEE